MSKSCTELQIKSQSEYHKEKCQNDIEYKDFSVHKFRNNLRSRLTNNSYVYFLQYHNFLAETYYSMLNSLDLVQNINVAKELMRYCENDLDEVLFNT